MMGNEIENLAELKELVCKLKALLDDPHPGLITWCMAYGKTMEQLVKFWQDNYENPISRSTHHLPTVQGNGVSLHQGTGLYRRMSGVRL